MTNLSQFRGHRQSWTDPHGKENEADVEAAQETKVFGRVCSGTAATRVTDNNGGLSSSHRSQTATPSTYAARTVRALAYVQVQLQFTQPTYNRIPERFPCTYTLPIKSSASRTFAFCRLIRNELRRARLFLNYESCDEGGRIFEHFVPFQK